MRNNKNIANASKKNTDTFSLYKQAFLIREVEKKLFELYEQNKIHGTLHTCIGQELSAVAISKFLIPGDSLFSTHRCHGHYLAYSEDIKGLLGEILGLNDGVCGGIGGSQHLCNSEKSFYSNGIQGGMVPVAAGKAFSCKLKNDGNIVAAFIGDGTMGEGIVYETLNICAVWNIPILIVVENNHYAQSTLTSSVMAGSIKKRAEAFNIAYARTQTNSWEKIIPDVDNAVNYVRTNRNPLLLEIDTYRLVPHSKGDDYRDKKEIQKFYNNDPLNKFVCNNSKKASEITSEIRKKIDDCLKQLQTSQSCQFVTNESVKSTQITWKHYAPTDTEKHISSILYQTFVDSFASYSRMIMLGEDIEAPYGGAFKITRDLSLLFPDRVYNTPISEAAIVGIGTGLAMGGFSPIIEIMFSDFLTLILDQLLQHASKFSDMYNNQVKVPLIIRTPTGGGRGYGPTHSQSIEKFFLGIPGSTVLALNDRISPRLIYINIFESISNPTLVLENKTLYTHKLKSEITTGYQVLFSNEIYPTVKITPELEQSDITVLCYGGMLDTVEEAIYTVFNEEDILCEIICPTQIYPLNISAVSESVKKTRRLLVVEEGTSFAAFGSEVIANLIESEIKLVKCERYGYSGLIPACLNREKELLPSSEGVFKKIKEMCYE